MAGKAVDRIAVSTSQPIITPALACQFLLNVTPFALFWSAHSVSWEALK